ncbi:MAG TPA: FAD-linked oxidase C-terminal domain-containing protein [Anaerolineae bacterium]|nr:FAD-linked oxidase C-terminal domain-containing protein [Anaerolineae bacterium]
MLADEASQELIHDLRRAIRGQVKFDRLTRQLYSTDASNYRCVPAGVVIPRDADDIAAAATIADRYQASIVPRGSGSSLAGQAVGPGVILDHTRYLNRILEINAEERWARVEAGVVLDQLNAALSAYGLMVGPNPASGPVATLGGMAANNSTGSHSIRYGLMVDHVREVEVVLPDGARAVFGPKTPVEVEALARHSTPEGTFYREIPRLVERCRDDIATGYPRTWRNVAGYNLNRLLADRESGRPFNLASLIVGSEGTLANIVGLTLNLVPCPKHTRLMLLHFGDMRSALETVPFILEDDPAAVELLDRVLIRAARAHPEFGPRVNRFVDGDPRAVLIVEFAGDEPSALAAHADVLALRLSRQGYPSPIIHCLTPEAIANVWSVRREVNGLLQSRPGDEKPLAIVDDAAVPLDRLADYVEEVERACREIGVEVNFDSHASAGCLHLNPAINLKTVDGLNRMKVISQAVMRIALIHHGTTTGEHGEGLARSYYDEPLYGPRLHRAFCEVKALFDPRGRMNPGKIVDAPAPWEPSLLRFHPKYQTPLAPAATFFDFAPHTGFAGLVEMCNGQGVCRALGEGVMCPSFRATRDEMHSTRGRANALRAALTGQLGPHGMTSRELYEALDLCLECKACQRECSSLVDMSRLKVEFLAHYQARHGIPLRSRLFAHVATLNRWGSRARRLVNWGYRNPLVRAVLDRTLGIDRRRAPPALAPRTFHDWFRRHPRPASAPRGRIVLWDDTYLTYNEPEIGQAAARVLEAAGFQVELVADRRCCGRPMISKGLLEEARANATHNVARLAPLAAEGIPIVGLEPSCIATFRDEYPSLLPTDAAREVAANTFFIEEFITHLAQRGELNLPFSVPEKMRRVLVHGHCYQKALATTTPLLAMLRLLPNTSVDEILSGCCGLAGAFGYEREHYEISMACGEDRLFPALRAAAPETLIAAAGISCRHQIRHGTGRQAVHPIVILADALML